MKNSSKIMKLVFVFSIIFLTLVLTSCGGDGDSGTPGSEFNYWLGPGPEGGNVFSLTIDPVNTTTLYAGTIGGGVVKSIDGGANWTVINTGLTYTDIRALAVAPVTTDTIYTGSMGGVFRSLDGGANWTAINTGLNATTINALAIDPVNTAMIYAGTWGGGVFTTYVPDGNQVLIEAYATRADSAREAPRDKLTTVAEPINVANGNMFTSQQDIFIPGNGIPLELTRTYNSQSDYDGAFGYGWRSTYDVTLTEQADGTVKEIDRDEVWTFYTPNGDGTYTPSTGKYSTLIKNPDESYTLTRKHGTVYSFNSEGKLTQIEDRNGNCTTVLYDSGGTLSSIIDSGARTLTFTRNSQGRITRTEDPAGRIFTYEYEEGNLIKVTDPSGSQTTYQYDEERNLVEVTDANGHSTHYVYSPHDRAIHTGRYGSNNEVFLKYDLVTLTSTTVTDSKGNQTVYEYNKYGLVTKIIDAMGYIRTTTWDENMNRISQTDANGNITKFTYDEKGNLLRITDPLKNETLITCESVYSLVTSITDFLLHQTQYNYDANGNLIETTDALGNIAFYVYDSFGNLTSITDANTNTTYFEYDSYGNLDVITDLEGHQIHFAYDILGNTVSTTDARGNATFFTYDELNRLIQISYPAGPQVTYTYDGVGNLMSVTDPDGHATDYSYDAVNRLAEAVDALGYITGYSYDTESNRIAVTDANGNTIQYNYDSLNRLVKVISPSDKEKLFTYDAVGNRITITDANGNTINYTYDALNRLIEITYPDTSKVSFSYDDTVKRILITDSLGTTTYTYDGLNRLIETDGPGVNDSIAYAYDNAGNRIQMVSPDAMVTTYEYDLLNRLISLTDPQDKTTTYSYDEASNLLQMSYPNNTTADYTFDKLNRLLSLTNEAGINTISSYDYKYNLSGMRTMATLNDGSYVDYSYDALNRLNTESKYSSQGGEIYSSDYTFDGVGNRLTYETTVYHNFNDGFNRPDNLDVQGGWSGVAGDWKIDNNRLFMPNARTDTIIIYPDENISEATIEVTARLKTAGNKKGSYIVFAYQNPSDFYYAGLEGISDLWVIGHYQKTGYNDLITLSEPIEKSIDYRLRVIVADNTATLESFEDGMWIAKLSYTFSSLASGKVGLSVEKSRTRFGDFKVSWQAYSKTTYTYNQENQLIHSITDGLTTTYVYDNNGNLIKKTEDTGTTDYAYDYENRLTQITYPDTTTSEYQYDGTGKRIQSIENGVITQYLHDGLNAIIERNAGGATQAYYTRGLGYGGGIGGIISAVRGADASYYHYDGMGSVTELTDSTAAVIQSYTYDGFGNRFSQNSVVQNPYGFNTKHHNSKSGLIYFGARYYDPLIGRFLQTDPLGINNDINLYN